MRHALTAMTLLLLASSSHTLLAATPANASEDLLATDMRGNGLSFSAYSASEDMALVQENSASLISMYQVLVETIGVDPSAVKWAEIAFIRNNNYIPSSDKEGIVRWVIPLTTKGGLGISGKHEMFLTIPHEQVHAIQKVFGDLPRWFSEGMAEWAGLRATKVAAPGLYADRKKQLNAALASSAVPLNLKSWGGVKPKPEAILRQLTPEQKRRMAKEPGYFPSGPFSFGPDDFISDESNTFARYAASLRIFEAIESRSTSSKMREWFDAIINLPSPKKTSDIVRLAKEKTGADISEMLD